MGRSEMKRELVAMLSNDVETTSIWFNDLRDKTRRTCANLNERIVVATLSL